MYSVTTNVHLMTANDKLTATATNFETTSREDAACEVKEEGAALVTVDLLVDIVNALQDETVSLRTTKTQLVVEGKNGNARLNLFRIDDYPFLPPLPDSIGQIEASKLRHAIRQVAPAIAQDNTRPALTGMCWTLADHQIAMAAADGFRLHVKTLPVNTDTALQVIVPKTSVQAISKAFSSSDMVDIHLVPDGPLCGVSDASQTVMAQRIASSYPDFRRLVPTTWEQEISINVAAMQEALKAVAPFANENDGIVRFVWDSPGGLAMSARGELVGDGVVTIECQANMEGKVALHLKYISDMLAAISGEQLVMRAKDPTSPVLFVPADDDPFLCVIMPMQVLWD